MGDISAVQPVLSEDTVINVQDTRGQIAVGHYILQIGSAHGGVVSHARPEQQLRPRLRPLPIFLRPSRFPNLLDRKSEINLAASALPALHPVEFLGRSGIGKTSLLRHLAYHLPLTSWTDGIIYLSARRQPVADLLQSLFEIFL